MSAVTTRFLIYLLIIFSLFPYIQILPLGTDSQPNALLIAMCMFPFCSKWKMNKNLGVLFGILTVAFILLFISPFNFNAIRSFMNYLTLFIVSYVSFFALKKIKGIPYKLFKISTYIWFIVGTIQLFIYPNFMSFLIPRGDSGATIESGRGIVCLAPEPTFYGLTCLIFGLIAFLNFNKKQDIKKIYIILAIQLFLYSRSSLVIFLLIATFGLYILILFFAGKGNKLKKISFISVSIILFLIIVNLTKDILSGNRFGMLLLLSLEQPEKFIILDASVNERFIHVYFPIYGFIKDFGLPHGYGTFPDFMKECMNMSEFQHLFSDYVLKHTNPTRIMSGWGSLLYELGIFGLFLISILYFIISKLVSGKQKIIFFFLIFCILLNAIPFSNPLIPFFIGNLIYLNYEKRKINSNFSH